MGQFTLLKNKEETARENHPLGTNVLVTGEGNCTHIKTVSLHETFMNVYMKQISSFWADAPNWFAYYDLSEM